MTVPFQPRTLPGDHIKDLENGEETENDDEDEEVVRKSSVDAFRNAYLPVRNDIGSIVMIVGRRMVVLLFCCCCCLCTV
jgi:hypothetical protein